MKWLHLPLSKPPIVNSKSSFLNASTVRSIELLHQHSEEHENTEKIVFLAILPHRFGTVANRGVAIACCPLSEHLAQTMSQICGVWASSGGWPPFRPLPAW
jgi:hypothetical protein